MIRLTLANLLVIFAVLAGGLWPIAAGAQTGDVPDAQTLRQRLAKLQAQIHNQQAALAAAQTAAAAELGELAQQRDALASQAVQTHLEQLALQQQAGDLADRIAELSPQARSYHQAAWRITRSAARLAEQLSLYLDELPAHDFPAAAVRRAAEQLQAVASHEPRPPESGPQPRQADETPESLLPDWPAAFAKTYTQLLLVLQQVDQQAQQVAVVPMTLRTAGGQVEQVQLLRVGHIAFAYQADQRVGVALRSPADASGYRWSEAVSPAVAQGVRDMMLRVQQAVSGPASVPMDVTAQMRAESLLDETSLHAQWRAGGPVMWPLGAVALLALVLSAERFWTLFVRNGHDPQLADRVIAAACKDPARALRIAQANTNTAGRTVAAMLRRRDAGQHAMEDSVQEQLLAELPRLQRFLGGIAILAAVAPLLGLLGTVTGIINTFGVIRAVGQASPGLMAGGISEALITTAAGLMIAIPALLLHGIMRGRVDRIISEAERQAAAVLNALAHDRAEHAAGESLGDA